MTITIRLDTSPLSTQHQSGVAQYTGSLRKALELDKRTHLSDRTIMQSFSFGRIYTKLQSYNTAPPFDIFLPKVDLTIFPNFATWPTVKSRLRATVIHDLTYIYYPEVVEAKNLEHLRRVVPRSIDDADFIITVSESVKAELIKEFNLDPEHCIVTPIPPGAEFYQKNDLEVHKKYKIPTKKYIYFIGNLEPRKNLSTLIEAYLQLPNDIRNEYSLIMAGSQGWKNESLKQSIQEAVDAGENVRHLGFIDQTDSPALYQNASLFVMSSLYEGFGIPILESMASGTPVVTSDIPILREVGGEASVYANPADPTDFRDKIMRSLHEGATPEWKQLAKDNLERFSWDNNVEKIISTTNKFLKQKVRH